MTTISPIKPASVQSIPFVPPWLINPPIELPIVDEPFKTLPVDEPLLVPADWR